MWPGYFFEEVAITCGLSWPCRQQCEEDFSNECPTVPNLLWLSEMKLSTPRSLAFRAGSKKMKGAVPRHWHHFSTQAREQLARQKQLLYSMMPLQVHVQLLWRFLARTRSPQKRLGCLKVVLVEMHYQQLKLESVFLYVLFVDSLVTCIASSKPEFLGWAVPLFGQDFALHCGVSFCVEHLQHDPDADVAVESCPRGQSSQFEHDWHDSVL